MRSLQVFLVVALAISLSSARPRKRHVERKEETLQTAEEQMYEIYEALPPEAKRGIFNILKFATNVFLKGAPNLEVEEEV